MLTRNCLKQDLQNVRIGRMRDCYSVKSLMLIILILTSALPESEVFETS